METRNIQSIGGSSFSVTLPKKWVSLHHLKNKDSVAISEQRSGALQLLPESKTRQRRKQVSIEGLEGDELYREMIVLYILGFEEIELRAAAISLKQRQVVRSVTQKLAGMEPIEESSGQIYLKSFLDAEKFSFQEYLGKIFLMTRLMFADSINAFLRRNRELAADVVERDFEIDKIDFLFCRMKYSLMSGRVSEEQLKASLSEADFYESVARQLERIADHAVKISKLTQTNPMPQNRKLEKALTVGSEKIILLLQQAENFSKAIDKKMANGVLQEIQKMPPHSSGVYEEMVKFGYAPALILNDSFDRIAGYIVNMAEYTLAQAMM